jgi:pentose-5-phosphate-3-epimerase
MMLDFNGDDWFHCDMINNIFDPHMSYGQSIIKNICCRVAKPLDVQLLVVHR